MAKKDKNLKKDKDFENKKDKELKEKQEVPILKNPSKSLAGRIVIWILLIAMALGGIGTIIYFIVKASQG